MSDTRMISKGSVRSLSSSTELLVLPKGALYVVDKKIMGIGLVRMAPFQDVVQYDG